MFLGVNRKGRIHSRHSHMMSRKPPLRRPLFVALRLAGRRPSGVQSNAGHSSDDRLDTSGGSYAATYARDVENALDGRDRRRSVDEEALAAKLSAHDRSSGF